MTNPAEPQHEDETERNRQHDASGKEVLAHLGFGPAFPGILLEPDPEKVAMTGPGWRIAQPLLVSLAIARWIGILQEAHFGSAQVTFTWHADTGGFPVLAIEDDPWDEDPETQPRLVYPDEQGRYALEDCWVALTGEQAADWRAGHAAVLDQLAATEPGPDTPATITDYLQLGLPYRDFDPDGHIRGIRRALADYPDRQSPDPLVDVVTDRAAESSAVVAVFLNGRPVFTDRCVTFGAGTGATSTDRDAIYDAIEQAQALLTPPAAALVRALLESRLPAIAPSRSAFQPFTTGADVDSMPV